MRRKGQQAENDKTERVTGLGRRTREEIAKWNQMTALRFQTGGRHQTSPASLRGGSEQHQEMHEKEERKNWIGEQRSEIEENLRKNNSKRAYQLMKDLATVKQGKATTVKDCSE